MSDGPDSAPPSLWRLESSFVVGLTGTISRLFILGLNRIEVHGLDGFLKVLEQRKDVAERKKGLITGWAHHVPCVATVTLIDIATRSIKSHQCVRSRICSSQFKSTACQFIFAILVWTIH